MDAEKKVTALRLAQLSFLLMVFLLGWMKMPLNVRGLSAYPMDAAYLAALSFWLVALARKETSLRFHPAYWLLVAYFIALSLSLFGSDDPKRTAFKLLTQAYLLSLPVLTFNLFRTLSDFRRVFAWWLVGTSIVATIGVGTLLLFPLFGPNSFLDWPLHHFGTLPPGPYPRLELTFQLPAMLAHYLATSLMLLLIAERLGWVGRRAAITLGGAVLPTAFFSLTPGLGGLLAMLAAWFWFWERGQRPFLARAVLFAGLAMPLLAVLLASVTSVHPTAPFLFEVPGLPTLAPAVRLLAWLDATRTFLETPLTGIGLGMESVTVHMQTRYCDLNASCVTDAHNTFLNIAVQAGIIGLAALCAIIWFVGRQIGSRSPSSPEDIVVFGLAVAWICGMALQGLVGSFEDTRHLWIFLGLLLSASAANAVVEFREERDLTKSSSDGKVMHLRARDV